MNNRSTNTLPTLPDDEQTRPIIRRIVWNQALWTAGYSLTSGGFLAYFGAELGARGLVIALLLAIPETAGISALLSRWCIFHLGGRKQTWFIFSLLARGFSVGIPLLAFPWFRPASLDPLWLMIGFLGASHACQAIAYVAYISWIADLVPDNRWGHLFSRRNVAKLSLLLIVPMASGFARDWWRKGLEEETALLAYVVAFGVGVLFLLSSMLPLLRLNDPAMPRRLQTTSTWRRFVDALRNRSLRFLLVHNWWLAFFNGMTQAAFFGLIFGVLHVSLGMYYVLANVMRLASIPVTFWAGTTSDRSGNKRLLVVSLLFASGAMPFWLLATPSRWWMLFGAYFLWSAFAAANISGRNLLLKLAPPSDNLADLALFRQVGGLVAGVAGVLGGIWLDRLNEAHFSWKLGEYTVGSYQLLFLVSWLGRMASVLWLLPVKEPQSEPTSHSS